MRESAACFQQPTGCALHSLLPAISPTMRDHLHAVTSVNPHGFFLNKSITPQICNITSRLEDTPESVVRERAQMLEYIKSLSARLDKSGKQWRNALPTNSCFQQPTGCALPSLLPVISPTMRDHLHAVTSINPHGFFLGKSITPQICNITSRLKDTPESVVRERAQMLEYILNRFQHALINQGNNGETHCRLIRHRRTSISRFYTYY